MSFCTLHTLGRTCLKKNPDFSWEIFPKNFVISTALNRFHVRVLNLLSTSTFARAQDKTRPRKLSEFFALSVFQTIRGQTQPQSRSEVVG